MKKVILFLWFLLLVVKGFADSYDFSAVCESGQTLYYKILPSETDAVAVVDPDWLQHSQPEGDLVIPDMIEHDNISYTVVRIAPEAFADCHGLTSVVIPDHCTFLGCYAFAWCESITSLVFGAAVDTIQWGAFEDCTGLQSICCKTPSLPFILHIPSNLYYQDHSIFFNVPTDIPVTVNCLAIDQFRLSMDWSRFTNMEGEFYGIPSLTVGVNNPEYGNAEIVQVPDDCEVTTATVRAIPNEGHVFGYWKRNDAVVSYQPDYTFRLDRDCILTACFDCAIVVCDSIGYPNHVIGRKMDASGLVTEELASDFVYDANGKLTNYSFPAHVNTTFSFMEYPNKPNSINKLIAGHPETHERDIFQYEDGQIKHKERWSNYDYNDDYHYYWDYFYEDHRLCCTEQTNDDDYYTHRHLYTYENENKTRIDNYYRGYGDNLSLSSVTTNVYNDRHLLLTSQTDTYNNAGTVTARERKCYSYTAFNKTDSVVTQTFANGVWINTELVHHLYDFKKRVVEYQTGSWSWDHQAWNITKKIIYDYNDDLQTLTVSFRKKNADEWVWDSFTGQTVFHDSRLYEWQRALSDYSNRSIGQLEFSMHHDMVETNFPFLSEWFYKIVWENGSITYQHLEYEADTTIGTVRPKIIVRTNTIYDKDAHQEVTHEYIKEENNKVYWWNKELHLFTTLYDYNANTGDIWEIKVGTESIMVHVDGVEAVEYGGETYKMLHVSDANHDFDGDIVAGIGHLTSFFPEKMMNKKAGFEVNGLRCYWVGDALLYHNGDEDCDAIHSVLNTDEVTDTEGFLIHPNPTNDVIVVTSVNPSPSTGKYRITNLMGQTLMEVTRQPNLTIDVSSLPPGVYCITLDHQTLKFTKQ